MKQYTFAKSIQAKRMTVTDWMTFELFFVHLISNIKYSPAAQKSPLGHLPLLKRGLCLTCGASHQGTDTPSVSTIQRIISLNAPFPARFPGRSSSPWWPQTDMHRRPGAAGVTPTENLLLSQAGPRRCECGMQQPQPWTEMGDKAKEGTVGAGKPRRESVPVKRDTGLR